MDGNLVPRTRVLGLGDKLEAVRDVEGTPSLVAIWAGGTGVTRLAAVGAETDVEAAAAFLLSKRRADTPGGIDVHSVGCRGWLLVLQVGLGGLGDRLGDKRRAGGILELMTIAGGVVSGLVGLDRCGYGNKRLKGNGEGTTVNFCMNSKIKGASGHRGLNALVMFWKATANSDTLLV